MCTGIRQEWKAGREMDLASETEGRDCGPEAEAEGTHLVRQVRVSLPALASRTETIQRAGPLETS